MAQGRTWSGAIVFNVAMVTIGVGCGIGATLLKDQASRRALLTGAALMYVGQLTESFRSYSWGLLTNQVSQNEAYSQLESYQKMPPRVSCSIRNYHYELKEIIEKRVIAVDADAQALRRDYKK